MSERVGRTFNFPRDLWEKLDEDADRCLRSSTKQLEAILKTYYGFEDVGLNQQSLENLGKLAPHSKQKIPVIRATVENKKKRKKA